MNWLDEIEKRAKAATPEEWLPLTRLNGESGRPHDVVTLREGVVGHDGVYGPPTPESVLDTLSGADADFIANARTDVLNLVAALRLAAAGLKRIDRTLRVPAAEHVPAIGDAFTEIDRTLAEIEHLRRGERKADHELVTEIYSAKCVNATNQHCFNIKGKGWVQVEHIKAGDTIIQPGGEEIIITSIAEIIYPTGDRKYQIGLGEVFSE